MSYFEIVAVILSAYVLDMMLGDPRWLPHPVRWIGRLITLVEGALRRFAKSPSLESIAGAVLFVVVVGLVFAFSIIILSAAHRFSLVLYFALSIYMAWACLSVRSLKDEAAGVLDCLKEDNIHGARARLSDIVGRDTDKLSKDGVLKAVIETVSENASDGVIAPLFYLALGGPALAAAYKAINTLDSMVGYKDERFVNMGWFSAKVDDWANYVPARITALLMVLSSLMTGSDWKGSFKILKRDGRAFSSPNAGLPQAAVAGALGIRLGGTMHYRGVVHKKPFIGDGPVEVSMDTVMESIRLMHMAALFMTLFIVLLYTALSI